MKLGQKVVKYKGHNRNKRFYYFYQSSEISAYRLIS